MSSLISQLRPLTDAAVRSEADGRAEIIQSIVGRTRYLYELVAGNSAVSGEEPSTPRNPQGGVGADLSGPPWGSAIMHPCAVASGYKPPNTTDWQAPGSAGQSVFATVSLSRRLTLRFPFFCRPYETLPSYDAPYSRLYPVIRAYHASATTATITVTCHTGAYEMWGGFSADVVVSGTSETTYEPACYFSPVPGAQELILEITSDDSETTTIASLVLGHQAKRHY